MYIPALSGTLVCQLRKGKCLSQCKREPWGSTFPFMIMIIVRRLQWCTLCCHSRYAEKPERERERERELYCETRSCHAGRHNDLEGHSNFSVLFIVSPFCAWNITTVEINSGVPFTYLKVKSAKCLCLLPPVLILVLRIWSCLHHCITYWSIPRYCIISTELCENRLSSFCVIPLTNKQTNKLTSMKT